MGLVGLCIPRARTVWKLVLLLSIPVWQDLMVPVFVLSVSLWITIPDLPDNTVHSYYDHILLTAGQGYGQQ